MIIMWLIWFLCNSLVDEVAPWTACGIIDKAECLLDVFRYVNSPLNTAFGSHVVICEAPPVGLFKINLMRRGIKLAKKLALGVII